MKYVVGAFALCVAVPSVAQTAPASDPHAGHAQHQQASPAATAQQGHAGHAGYAGHAGMKGMDHAAMMRQCKDPNASAEVKAHCAMMKEHGHKASASSPPGADHSGHAH